MWLLMVLVKTIFQTQSKLNDNILLALELYWLAPIICVLHSLWSLKLGCSQLLNFKSNHVVGLRCFTLFLFQLIQLRNRLFIVAKIVFQS